MVLHWFHMNVVRFRTLLRAVLLSAGPCAVAAATPACSSEDRTQMPELAQCVDVRAASRYSGLTLSPRVDGIAFATRGDVFNGRPVDSTSPGLVRAQRLSAIGAPCSKATDREGCARRVESLLGSPDSAGWEVRSSGCGDCDRFSVGDLGVITAGDDVRLATLDDVVRAAAPVDTRDEAATILALKGYAIDCDQNNVRTESDGWTFKRTSSSCSGAIDEQFYKVLAATGEVVDAGSRQVRESDNNCIEGRRPANLVSTGVNWLSSLAACFSEIAHMEAAAVLAFDVLEDQLRGLGAPLELLERAARAKQDEIAHAAITSRLAHRFGGAPKAPRLDTARDVGAQSPLLRLALENAVEGCVREAYGALVAAFQGAHATDAAVRAAFTRIATDEAEHAELSFDIDAWLAPLLTADERRQVDAAKAQAWLDLATSCNAEPAADVVTVAGIPSASDARALLADLVWAAGRLAA